MAYSFVEYTGNGSTTDRSIPFPFLERDHITVKVNGVVTAFTWLTASTIRISPAPASGATIRIERLTPLDPPLVDFVNGSTPVAEDFDRATLQSLYAAQELDDSVRTVGPGATVVLVAGDQNIAGNKTFIGTVSGPNPTSLDNLATKEYVDSLSLGAPGAGRLDAWYFGAVPPSNPAPGDNWLDSVGGRTFTWVDDGNSAAWVEVTAVPAAGEKGVQGPPGAGTDLSYTASTRLLASSSGADVTLPLLSSTNAGLAPASGGGTTNFLRADGTWVAPPAGATDLSYTASTRLLASSTGADVTLPLATGTDAGLMASADFTKLAGVASGATANSSDATLLNRANHTGTQAWSTLTGTPTTRAGYGITDAAANGAATGSGLTMATARILGRTTAGSGALEEISVGANLTLSGGSLSAATQSTDLSYTASTRLLASSSGADVTLPLLSSTDAGLAPASGGGTTNFLRADGTWAAPPGGSGSTDLSYTASTRLLASSTGADVTLPLVSSTDAGLAPASGGGTTNFLRADGTWAAPAGGTGTDLSYTASTRLLASNTGADVTLPLFTSTDAGLTPSSGGGTTNFLRADGTWAAPAGGGNVTTSGTPSSGQAAEWTSSTAIQGVAVTGTGSYVKATAPALSAATYAVAATVTAGTNAQGQGALTADVNVITTASNNPSGVTLPTATTGRRLVIVNRGANPINVYPATGGTIDGGAANASIQIGVNSSMRFNASSTTAWFTTARTTMTAPVLGTPVSGTLTNCTGLPGSGLTGAYTAAGLTMATARLLGRTTAASGAAEEISVGANLTLSGGTLSATTQSTDLSYTASTRLLASSTGADVTLPLLSSTDAGLAPASGGGTSNFLRADGTWAAPPGGAGTNLSYTASTRLLASDTGADVTLPLVSSTDAGLAPASGGGTTNFLRADGTWAAPPGGGGAGSYTFSANPPSSPSDGAVWCDSDIGVTFVYMSDGTSGQWYEAGAPGAAQTPTITLGTVSTGTAGSSVIITNTGTPNDAIFNFTIPRGDAGTNGTNGTAATIAVGSTTTGSPGTNASVVNSGTSSAAVFDFTIPRGDVGATGPMGPKSVTLTAPTASEKIPLFHNNGGSSLTIAEIRSLVSGTSPSATFSIRYGTDFSAAGTEVVTSGITVTNTTTGLSTTSFNNATVPNGNWVWLTTSAISGTVNTLHATLRFS